jgi:hypothetical protein
MTLHDDLFAAAALPGLFEQFGVSCTYRPAAGGGERTVTAILDYEGQQDRGDELGEELRERLWATVTRDESDDAAYPGIRYPERGDGLLVAGDAASEAWSFQGQLRDPADDRWTLLFARNRPRRYGPR